MKRYIFHALISAILLLLCVLAGLWFHRDGSLRHTHWQAPKPQTQDFTAMVPELPARMVGDPSRYLAMLERPIFSPSRRPPPPPPSPPPPEVLEPVLNVHLYGVYGGENGGGAIVRIDGKNRRVQLNELINGWRLSTIGERSVVLKRGARTKTIEVVHVIPAATDNAPKVAGGVTAPTKPPSTPASLARERREAQLKANAERARIAREKAASAPTSP